MTLSNCSGKGSVCRTPSLCSPATFWESRDAETDEDDCKKARWITRGTDTMETGTQAQLEFEEHSRHTRQRQREQERYTDGHGERNSER